MEYVAVEPNIYDSRWCQLLTTKSKTKLLLTSDLLEPRLS